MRQETSLRKAVVQLAQVVEELAAAPECRPIKLDATPNAAIARALAVGGHTCRDAVEHAVKEFLTASDAVQLADALTDETDDRRQSGAVETLIGNLRIKVRQVQRQREHLLNLLGVQMFSVDPGSEFDTLRHTPREELVPASSAAEEGCVAAMHEPGFVWREEGVEQVIPAKVSLFGPRPDSGPDTEPERKPDPKSGPRSSSSSRRSRRKKGSKSAT